MPVQIVLAKTLGASTGKDGSYIREEACPTFRARSPQIDATTATAVETAITATIASQVT
jgi:hypothetical protein